MGARMQVTDEPQLPASAGARSTSGEAAGPRKRAGLARETMIVRGLQVALGLMISISRAPVCGTSRRRPGPPRGEPGRSPTRR